MQIGEWHHAADCIKRVAFSVFSTQPERAAWLKQNLDQLWAGAVPNVIVAWQTLATRSDEARRTVGYFTEN